MPVPRLYPTIPQRRPRTRFSPRGMLKVLFVLGVSTCAALAMLACLIYSSPAWEL